MMSNAGMTVLQNWYRMVAYLLMKIKWGSDFGLNFHFGSCLNFLQTILVNKKDAMKIAPATNLIYG